MNWLELLDDKDKVIKGKMLSDDEFKNACELQLKRLKDFIDNEFDCIYVTGKQYADWFWTMRDIMIDDKNEFSRFGTRVKIKSGTISFEWYKNRVTAPSSDSKKQVFSQYLPKGKDTDGYPLSTFKNALEWEANMIREVESRYVVLRKRAKVLSKMRMNIKEYERLLSESYKPMNE